MALSENYANYQSLDENGEVIEDENDENRDSNQQQQGEVRRLRADGWNSHNKIRLRDTTQSHILIKKDEAEKKGGDKDTSLLAHIDAWLQRTAEGAQILSRYTGAAAAAFIGARSPTS